MCFLSAGQQGATPLVAKRDQTFVSISENDPTLHLIYFLFIHFANEFMVSVTSVKSSSTQHDVHFVNYGHYHDLSLCSQSDPSG